MSLTGQLNDLSLGELIEFFCNQRKTGRLKVDYALAPGVFFINGGELVDAKVGALNGAEAIYFAMTLPSASFDFSAGMQSSRRTINDRWASVVLEGLRRIDEGLPAASADAFVGDDSLDEATLDYMNCVEESKAKAAADKSAADTAAAKQIDEAFERPAPFAMTVEAAAGAGGGRRGKVMFASVAAAIIVVCAVAAIPLSKRLSGKAAPVAVAAATAPVADAAPQTEAPPPADANNLTAAPEAAPTPDATAAEEAARRERETRERESRERARKQREEAARRTETDAAPSTEKPAAKPATPAGAKAVRVQISYDEAGRVTQAAAVGTTPGAEAYASTAVRVARGRRFPAGKAGTTVVTIPIN